jgi:hypothetical protein
MCYNFQTKSNFMNTNNHKRQIFWQIYFPMLLIFGVLAFFSYSFFGKTILGELDLRIWSDISLLVIALPLLFFFVFTFIFLFLIIYIISRYRSAISTVFLNIGNISTTISQWTSKITNFITHPVIQIESFVSQLLSHKKR